jgi:hypothetical protein
MPRPRTDGSDTPFPTRGVPGGWRDVWEDDPVIEGVVARLTVAASDVATQRIAADLQREEKRERKRRERARRCQP